MDCIVRGVAKSWTRLSDFHFHDDFLELTPRKDVLLILGGWNVKLGSQEMPGVAGKFGLRVQSETGQRLTEFC